jgi:hypothetical protein
MPLRAGNEIVRYSLKMSIMTKARQRASEMEIRTVVDALMIEELAEFAATVYPP